MRVSYEADPVRVMFGGAKARSKARSLPFDIDLPYLRHIWAKSEGRCSVTGLPFDLAVTRGKRPPYRPSLDRIENDKGYVKGNVRFVLWAVNLAMNNYGEHIFLTIAKAAIEHPRK